jgi:hypothetical protein
MRAVERKAICEGQQEVRGVVLTEMAPIIGVSEYRCINFDAVTALPQRCHDAAMTLSLLPASRSASLSHAGQLRAGLLRCRE